MGDFQVKFERLKFAVTILGTNMLRKLLFSKIPNYVSSKQVCDLRFKTDERRRTIGQKCFEYGLKSLDINDFYVLCSLGFLRDIHATTDWSHLNTETSHVLIGDDIKRIKSMNNYISNTESSFDRNTSLYIANMWKEFEQIIKRFCISEGIDYAEKFRHIGERKDITNMKNEIDICCDSVRYSAEREKLLVSYGGEDFSRERISSPVKDIYTASKSERKVPLETATTIRDNHPNLQHYNSPSKVSSKRYSSDDKKSSPQEKREEIPICNQNIPSQEPSHFGSRTPQRTSIRTEKSKTVILGGEQLSHVTNADIREIETKFEELGKFDETERVSDMSHQLVISRIYFDFVPPAMNKYDYIMKELTYLQKKLSCEMGKRFKDIFTSRKFFTFMHSKQLTTKDACVSLFDAVPTLIEHSEIPNPFDSKLSIGKMVICYLDDSITFDTLQQMTMDKCLREEIEHHFKDRKKDIRCAVKSPELLTNSKKLRNRLTVLVDQPVEVIDVSKENKRLFHGFYEELNDHFKTFKKIYKSKCNANNGNSNAYTDIENQLKRLQQIRETWYGQQRLKIKSKIREQLCRLHEFGVMGYTMDRETLQVFVQENNRDKLTWLLRETLGPTVKYKMVSINNSKIFRLFHKIKPGSKIHPDGVCFESYGTLGMFCRVVDRSTKTPTFACLTAAHVISKDQDAYTSIDDRGMVPLGKCIWPVNPDQNKCNIRDISVIKIDIDIIKNILEEDVILFDRERENLSERKVFKYGATTGKTFGRVINANFALTGQPSKDAVIIEHENKDELFSEAGDSGSIILTRFGQNLVAFAFILGGLLRDPELPKNATVGVDLSEAVKTFQSKTNKNIVFDKF